MLQPLTVVLLVGSGVLGLLAAHHLLRGRLVDDPLIIVGAVIELALLVQLVVGLGKASATASSASAEVRSMPRAATRAMQSVIWVSSLHSPGS